MKVFLHNSDEFEIQTVTLVILRHVLEDLLCCQFSSLNFSTLKSLNVNFNETFTL